MVDREYQNLAPNKGVALDAHALTAANMLFIFSLFAIFSTTSYGFLTWQLALTFLLVVLTGIWSIIITADQRTDEFYNRQEAYRLIRRELRSTLLLASLCIIMFWFFNRSGYPRDLTFMILLWVYVFPAINSWREPDRNKSTVPGMQKSTTHYRLLALVIVHTIVVLSGAFVIIQISFEMLSGGLIAFTVAILFVLFYENGRQQKRKQIFFGGFFLLFLGVYAISPGKLRCDPVTNWGFNQMLGQSFKKWATAVLNTPEAQLNWQYSRFNHRRLNLLDSASLPVMVSRLRPQEVSIQGKGIQRFVNMAWRNWGLKIGADEFVPAELRHQSRPNEGIRKVGPGIYRFDINNG